MIIVPRCTPEMEAIQTLITQPTPATTLLSNKLTAQSTTLSAMEVKLANTLLSTPESVIMMP